MKLLMIIILLITLLALISLPEYTTKYKTTKGSGLKIATMY